MTDPHQTWLGCLHCFLTVSPPRTYTRRHGRQLTLDMEATP